MSEGMDGGPRESYLDAVNSHLLLVHHNRIDIPAKYHAHCSLALALNGFAQVHDAPAYTREDALEVRDGFFELRLSLRLDLVNASLKEVMEDLLEFLIQLCLQFSGDDVSEIAKRRKGTPTRSSFAQR